MGGRWITQRCRSDGGEPASEPPTRTHCGPPGPHHHITATSHEHTEEILLPLSASFFPRPPSPLLFSRAPAAREIGRRSRRRSQRPASLNPPAGCCCGRSPPASAARRHPDPLGPARGFCGGAANAVCCRVGPGGCEGGCRVLREGGKRCLGGGSVGDPVSGDAAGAAEEGGCGGSSDSCLFDVCS